ncbi:ATP-binding protein [Kitasatospora purpeofusca]|uniref:ATP-binding protein n=1 Tax=Kitasatospora purpeofusca TaxID=67352 RepID=UPI0035DB42D5
MTRLGAVGWARRLPLSAPVSDGRAWARKHLRTLGWGRDTPVADAVVLAVSELLTNAHIHARSDAELVLTWDGRCLRLSVHDHNPALPQPRDSGPEATGGRGLTLVAAMADHWQTHPHADGKTITACFHPPGPGK